MEPVPLADIPPLVLSEVLRDVDERPPLGAEHSHYRPMRPGEPWYPAPLADQRCHACERALRAS